MDIWHAKIYQELKMPQRHLLLGIIGSIILFVIAGLNLTGSLRASEPQQDQERPIRVVTKEIEPFVIKDQDRLTGFSIDLWKEMASFAGVQYEFVEAQTVTEQLDAVLEGEADVAIAAISMTAEREEDLDFSYPYYLAGLQIMTTGKPASTLSSLFSFLFSSRFLIGLAALFLILIAVGHITWLVERKSNPDFPSSYLIGIWEGLWWAAATVTTVGYGDKTVKDKWGRLLGIFWMFAGLFLIANFTAFVTAEATVSRLETSISGTDDLPGKKVVTVNGTTSAEYLREQRIPFRGVETIEEAYDLLEREDAEAIVYDAPVLQYYAATSGNPSLQVVGSPFNAEYYGIALPTNSPHKEQLNKALLEIIENGTFKELINKWYLSDLGQ
jgi:polar amino acid transport system substrate-binding protein